MGEKVVRVVRVDTVVKVDMVDQLVILVKRVVQVVKVVGVVRVPQVQVEFPVKITFVEVQQTPVVVQEVWLRVEILKVKRMARVVEMVV